MSKHTSWITTTFFLLVFYTFGASMMDSFAMYHTWRFVGDDDFSLMHIESGKRIVMIFVLPTFLMTVFHILLFWHRPKIVPKRLVWAAFAFGIIPWISSALIQIPIQIQLDQGKDLALLDWLILSDWLRVIPAWGLMISAFIMLKTIIEKVSSHSPSVNYHHQSKAIEKIK